MNKEKELIDELQEYLDIEDTSRIDLYPEEVQMCIEALEKQIGKKTIKQSTDEKIHYKCNCGYIFKTVYKHSISNGRITKYCECCGQKVDESEVE